MQGSLQPEGHCVQSQAQLQKQRRKEVTAGHSAFCCEQARRRRHRPVGGVRPVTLVQRHYCWLHLHPSA